MAEKRRDRCPECLAEFRVKADGTMGWHLGDLWVAGRQQMCSGVGKPPAVMHDPLGPDGWARGLIKSAADGEERK